MRGWGTVGKGVGKGGQRRANAWAMVGKDDGTGDGELPVSTESIIWRPGNVER